MLQGNGPCSSNPCHMAATLLMHYGLSFVKKCLLNTRTTPKPIMIKDYLKSPRSLSIRSLHPTAVTLVIKKVTVMVMNDLLSSLSFNVNLPSNSWDSAFSKFDIENPWSRPRVCSKLFRNLPLEISKVKTKIKTDSYIWGLVFNQSIHFSFYLKIWPWKSEVKVMTKVKTDGYIWGLVFNRYVHFFCFMAIGPFSADIAYFIFDLEYARSRSWPRSNLMVTFEAHSSIDIFVCFSWQLDIFGWDKANFIYDLENSRSRSQWISTKIWSDNL